MGPHNTHIDQYTCPIIMTRHVDIVIKVIIPDYYCHIKHTYTRIGKQSYGHTLFKHVCAYKFTQGFLYSVHTQSTPFIYLFIDVPFWIFLVE